MGRQCLPSKQASTCPGATEHFPRFLERVDAEGVSLPHFVVEECEAYLKCGRLEYGFLRVKCDA